MLLSLRHVVVTSLRAAGAGLYVVGCPAVQRLSRRYRFPFLCGFFAPRGIYAPNPVPTVVAARRNQSLYPRRAVADSCGADADCRRLHGAGDP